MSKNILLQIREEIKDECLEVATQGKITLEDAFKALDKMNKQFRMIRHIEKIAQTPIEEIKTLIKDGEKTILTEDLGVAKIYNYMQMGYCPIPF